ncbi:hypothetical protein [Paenibacillus agilis]|uniref:F0F1-type ATP synthase n=1 Tax=Paenibacillus agilis TaxID=3020863 RepID=A0A559IZQ3_9BACL|nr:hypothetical protein [Paenibacillus agilis]TVX93106.1 hypothetical protein FPZ44_08555 [Paenibacillus agilis]
MRLIKWAIFFACIILPFSWTHRQQVKEYRHKLIVEEQYNRWMNTAVDDAAQVLKETAAWKATDDSYESNKQLILNKQHAVTTLLHSIYVNLNIEDDVVAQQALFFYIPAITIVGYDGAYFYVNERFSTMQGSERIEHVWKPVHPYSYVDQHGNVYTFTLDDYVTVYDSSARKWISGYQHELKLRSSLSLLQDDVRFDDVRRMTIIQTIQQKLEHYINRHNEWARRNGVSYLFTMPTIPTEQWNNTINDISIMSFIQGMSVGAFTYNHYALGGSRILQRDTWYASIQNNVKVAYPERCAPSKYIETFSSDRDAASKGYYVKRCY